MSKPKPTCTYGHPLSGENLRIKPRVATKYANSEKGTYDERVCAECHRRHNRDYWWRKKQHESRKAEIVVRQTIAEQDEQLAP